MSTEQMIVTIIQAIERHQSSSRSRRIQAAWAHRGLSQTEGARENRARRSAERQGFVLQKSRRDLGDGPFLILDGGTSGLLTSERGISLEGAETWLSEEDGDSREQSNESPRPLDNPATAALR
jgi:hypothetical protein